MANPLNYLSPHPLKQQNLTRKCRSWVGWLDRMMKPRMAWLAKLPWNYVALLTCLAIAVTTPLMEFLPFVISIAAVAIGVFAAGILMRDGLVMLIGYALTAILVFASVQVA
ncbi:exopolysaccharide biosynthesis protein [Roseinatronobacter monicus]|uniref:exopolysaccharide biosynthesis protein n=1 Tax=Roseinatronobacter monicus TaxID=393481 RepID=UPI00248307E6|nr:exopolysaccharide biosynthesis protein [Roseinatronobacter monicus]